MPSSQVGAARSLACAVQSVFTPTSLDAACPDSSGSRPHKWFAQGRRPRTPAVPNIPTTAIKKKRGFFGGKKAAAAAQEAEEEAAAAAARAAAASTTVEVHVVNEEAGSQVGSAPDVGEWQEQGPGVCNLRAF